MILVLIIILLLVFILVSKREFYENISLLNSEGIINGYRPQIIRPFDSVSMNPSDDSDCKWPCYSDKKYQKWCSEDNAIRYHAMRPLITNEQYHEMINQIFKGLKSGTKFNELVSEQEKSQSDFSKNDSNFLENNYTLTNAVFCENSQKNIMNFIMEKINNEVYNTPSAQRNGSWEVERFYYIDQVIYEQEIKSMDKVFKLFKIVFGLYNPLRSTTTMVYAVLLADSKLNLELVDIGFVNKDIDPDFSKNTDYEDPYYMTEAEEDPIPWLYMNTINTEKFNEYGFYDKDSIEIEGGIPDSLKEKLKNNNCSTEQLMNCYTPRFTGIDAKGLVDINGKVKDVENNPLVYYNKLEKYDGDIYI